MSTSGNMFVTPQDACRPIKDVGELSGREPVLEVAGHPGLQQAGVHLAHCAATINEGLVHPSDLGDVGVDRNQSAIGHLEAQDSAGIAAEMFFELIDGHQVRLLSGTQQQSRSRTTQHAGMASSAPRSGAAT